MVSRNGQHGTEHEMHSAPMTGMTGMEGARVRLDEESVTQIAMAVARMLAQEQPRLRVAPLPTELQKPSKVAAPPEKQEFQEAIAQHESILKMFDRFRKMIDLGQFESATKTLVLLREAIPHSTLTNNDYTNLLRACLTYAESKVEGTPIEQAQLTPLRQLVARFRKTYGNQTFYFEGNPEGSTEEHRPRSVAPVPLPPKEKSFFRRMLIRVLR